MKEKNHQHQDEVLKKFNLPKAKKTILKKKKIDPVSSPEKNLDLLPMMKTTPPLEEKKKTLLKEEKNHQHQDEGMKKKKTPVLKEKKTQRKKKKKPGRKHWNKQKSMNQ